MHCRHQAGGLNTNRRNTASPTQRRHALPRMPREPGPHLFQERQESLERVTSSEAGLCCTWLCSMTSSKL